MRLDYFGTYGWHHLNLKSYSGFIVSHATPVIFIYTLHA